MYQTILLTNDGSEVAAAAIPHAATIAQATGAPVVLCQVIDSVGQMMTKMTPMIEPAPVGEVTVEIAEGLHATQRAEAEANLAAVKAQLEAQGVTSVSTMISEGPAGDAIVQAAKTSGADLIVMATHGRGGLGRALLGSVADHVVRNATCGVLLVRVSE